MTGKRTVLESFEMKSYPVEHQHLKLEHLVSNEWMKAAIFGTQKSPVVVGWTDCLHFVGRTTHLQMKTQGQIDLLHLV